MSPLRSSRAPRPPAAIPCCNAAIFWSKAEGHGVAQVLASLTLHLVAECWVGGQLAGERSKGLSARVWAPGMYLPDTLCWIIVVLQVAAGRMRGATQKMLAKVAQAGYITWASPKLMWGNLGFETRVWKKSTWLNFSASWYKPLDVARMCPVETRVKLSPEQSLKN